MLSTNLVDEAPVVLRSGRALIASIKITQFVFDAPALFLQVFNTNAPTVGTTAPVMVLPVPAGTTQWPEWRKFVFAGKLGGLQFATGLSLAVTTTHDGSTGPDAGDDPQVIVDWEAVG
jgi:hypothetical protein